MKNTSGYYRVSKVKDKRYSQGFVWIYVYWEGRKQKTIKSVDLSKLENKVVAKGLEWEKLDEIVN